jgi:hypothetical protein
MALRVEEQRSLRQFSWRLLWLGMKFVINQKLAGCVKARGNICHKGISSPKKYALAAVGRAARWSPNRPESVLFAAAMACIYRKGAS